MERSYATRLFAPPIGLKWGRLLLCAFFCMLFCADSAFTQQTPGPADQVGTITGTILDPNGNFVVSARIRLTQNGKNETVETSSDNEGHFVFAGVASGPFRLTITAEGFAPKELPGDL